MHEVTYTFSKSIENKFEYYFHFKSNISFFDNWKISMRKMHYDRNFTTEVHTNYQLKQLGEILLVFVLRFQNLMKKILF